VLSYRNAAVVLSETRSSEFSELIQSLRDFSITTTMIRTAGGNESAIPKLLTKSLRPKGWHETIIQGDLLVTLRWKEETGYDKRGKPIFAKRSRELRREKFLDGHKLIS
jgi:hypothetical protein